MSNQISKSKVLTEVLTANKNYVNNFGEKGTLSLPPARQFAILTCMDARLDPAKYAGLAEGDAHVIRNAGGRASDDAIRSLIISHKLLGTKEWFVIHHTDCGMELFSDEIIRDLLSKSLSTATVDENGWRNVEEEGGSDEAKFVSFLTFKNLAESVTEDVKRIKNHPLVAKNIPVYGYIYNVKSGELIEVPEATTAGSVI
jgi:carbonic anhydrase